MKRFIAIILTLSLATMLMACGTKYYEVTTKTGEIYTVKGSPQYDVDAQTYKFENEEGKEIILNKEEIEVIQEKNS